MLLAQQTYGSNVVNMYEAFTVLFAISFFEIEFANLATVTAVEAKASLACLGVSFIAR